MRARAVCWVAAVTLWGMVGCSDSPTENYLVSGRADFNERLRADKGPTLGMSTPRFYSDGGLDDREIVSELYHSMMDRSSISRLRRSECLWVQRDGFPLLSYEVVLSDVVIRLEDEDVPFEETVDNPLGTCGLRGRFAESREFADSALHSEEDERILRGLGQYHEWSMPRPEITGFTVGLRRCTASRPDPYGLCVPAEPCGPLTDARDVLNGGEPDYEVTIQVDYGSGEVRPIRGALLPYCWVEGGLAPAFADTSYQLQVVPFPRDTEVEGPIPNLEMVPHAVRPHLKVIPGSRTVARPLDFAGRSKGDGFDRASWRWTVAITADDLWEENYSPDLLVSTVRVFEEVGVNPDTGGPIRSYLGPDRIHVDLTRECEGDLDADTGVKVFDMVDCALTVTPTYRLDHLGQGVTIDDDRRLRWEVEFRSYTDGNHLPVPLPAESADLYIEFEVVDRTSGLAGALMIEPAGLNFGPVRVGTNPVFDNAFTVSNVGIASARVDSLSMDGPAASEFSVKPMGSVALPMTLRGLDAFELSVEAHPSSPGVKQAYVVVEGRDTTGQPYEVRAGVLTEAVDAILVVLPTSIFFHREDDSAPGILDYIRRFTVHNAGSADLERRSITVSGPDAAYFTVTESEYAFGNPEPVPTTRVISPGTFEDFTVVYHPRSQGFHEAEITIDTDVGSESIPIQGLCNGSCSYPSP